MNNFIKTLLIGCTLASIMQSYTVQADDTELYVLNVSQTNSIRPKILIILDNSGSMKSNYLTPYFSYDSNVNYITTGLSDPDWNKRGYFSATSGSLPDLRGASYYSNNNCNSSISSGMFTGMVAGWNLAIQTSRRNLTTYSGSWGNTQGQSNNNISYILDCAADNGNPATGVSGLPSNISPTATTDLNTAYAWNPYSAAGNASLSDNKIIYTANYLYYRSRIVSAKKAIKDIINSTYDSSTGKTKMDFGLEIFNMDAPVDSANGGRIIRNISNLTDVSKASYFSILDSVDGSTNTPLAESMWEAYRFFSGGHSGVTDNNLTDYGMYTDTSLPNVDSSALASSGKYTSPLSSDCADNAYIILVTDGDPTADNHADESIKSLTNQQSSIYQYTDTYPEPDENKTSFLPYLTEWMSTHDILDGNDGRDLKSGIQKVKTYTVSFGGGISASGKTILEATAKKGGGAYYNADSASALSSALNDIIKDIAARQFTMSAPSTAGSNTDKTQYLDNLYMTGFVPGKSPFWGGNLKKLKYTSTGIKDANNNLALDSNGRLLSTAKTYWSSAVDGDAIAKGGVQEMLAKLTAARTIYTNTSAASPALTLLDKANFTSDQQKLDLGLLATASTTDVSSMIDWIKGIDVDSTKETKPNRATIMGDMMHSHPLVINYGASSGDPDLRIIAGTNSGFLHMFKDAGDTVSETWAYIPYPLLKNQATLKAASIAVDHISGIDGSPVSYVVDKNSDGQILSSTIGDKAWVFVGQRQGGRSYYALNVTNPDSPSLKWIITGGTTTGFSRLGQTWSTPQVTKIPGYKDGDGNYKPVLVFAGGYDVNKDKTTIGSDDSTGNAIYFVDADTGALIFSVSPDATSATNLSTTTMLDSIPSDVTLFDSNGDGLTDRLYVGDTGGNVWRMDLPGTDKTKWSFFKLATLGSDATIADDRRFFGAPLIVRSINPKVTKLADGTYKYTQQPYDAVMLGSGNRNKPSSDKTVNNDYFMIRDMHPAVYGEAETKPADASAIDISSLYDITGNKIGVIASTGPTAAQLTEIVTLTSSKKGWFYKMTGSGEKVFGSGLVSNGILNFTSFIPEATAVGANQCSLGASIGSTRLYSIDMTYGYYTGLTAYTSTNDLLLENLGSYVDSSGKVVGLGLPGGSLVSGNNDSGVAQCAEGQSCLQACTSATGCNGQTPTTGDLLPHMEYQYTHETN